MEEERRKEDFDIVRGNPDINALHRNLCEVINNVNNFCTQQDINFDTRMCRWGGQNEDYKKLPKANQKHVFPFIGASDQRIPMIDGAIKNDVALLVNALQRASLMAIPTTAPDMARARKVTDYVRWMKESQIKELFKVAKVAANNLLANGLCVTGQFYRKEVRKVKTRLTLNDLIEQSHEFSEYIQNNDRSKARDLFKNLFPLIPSEKVDMRFSELTERGFVDIPRYSVTVDRPEVRVYSPCEQIFFPIHTTFDEEPEAIYMLESMSRSTLISKQVSEDWPREWIEKILDRSDTGQVDEKLSLKPSIRRHLYYDNKEVEQPITVIRAYQKKADEDNVTGIYETVYSGLMTSEENGVKPFAKSELLGYAHGQYPFVYTSLENLSANIYDTRGYAEIGKGFQLQYKKEVDATIDQSSMTTNPPMTGPPNAQPYQWGPLAYLEKPPGHEGVKFLELPQKLQSTNEVREVIQTAFDRYFVQSNTNLDSVNQNYQKQMLITTFLEHWIKVFRQLFVLNQQFGPEERQFRILGSADMQTMRTDITDEVDFYLDFDVTTNDPEVMDKKLERVMQMLAIPGTNINTDKLRAIGVVSADPMIAEAILEPQEDANEMARQQERNELAQIFAGIPSDVNPNDPANTLKLQEDMQYIQGPDVKQRLSGDPVFSERIQTRIRQRRAVYMNNNVHSEQGKIGGKLQGDITGSEPAPNETGLDLPRNHGNL